ncbi:hypothetical protein BH24CHL4_BH24CHL4_27130 [soil metagenome]
MSTNDTPVISQQLLDLLVCPVDHGALELEANQLRCTVCGNVYPIENGIPNMLVSGE